MVVDTQIQKFVWCSPGSLVILLIRDDCGPFEIIKNTSICIIIRKHLQFLGSAQQRMEYAQVGDREVQATTEKIKMREGLQ